MPTICLATITRPRKTKLSAICWRTSADSIAPAEIGLTAETLMADTETNKS